MVEGARNCNGRRVNGICTLLAVRMMATQEDSRRWEGSDGMAWFAGNLGHGWVKTRISTG
jgi:hypothetical protein